MPRLIYQTQQGNALRYRKVVYYNIKRQNTQRRGLLKKYYDRKKKI